MGAESTLEAAVVKYAKSVGCLTYKFSSPMHRGVPDRIIIAPGGNVLFLEFKAPGARLTKLQLRELLILESYGCYVAWTSDLGRAKAIIDNLLRKPDELKMLQEDVRHRTKNMHFLAQRVKELEAK